MRWKSSLRLDAESAAQSAAICPVFNYQGLVVGMNTAYLDGFSGSTLGISVRALRPAIEKALRER